MTRKRSAVLAALLALVVSVAALTAASTRATAAGKPIILGFVVDLSGNMSPFDAPALAAAQLEVARLRTVALGEPFRTPTGADPGAAQVWAQMRQETLTAIPARTIARTIRRRRITSAGWTAEARSAGRCRGR